MSIYNVLSLVVVIVAHYGIVNMLVYGKRVGSPVGAVWQGEGDLGIGEPALLVITKNATANGPSRATRALWPDLQATATAADPFDLRVAWFGVLHCVWLLCVFVVRCDLQSCLDLCVALICVAFGCFVSCSLFFVFLRCVWLLCVLFAVFFCHELICVLRCVAFVKGHD